MRGSDVASFLWARRSGRELSGMLHNAFVLAAVNNHVFTVSSILKPICSKPFRLRGLVSSWSLKEGWHVVLFGHFTIQARQEAGHFNSSVALFGRKPNSLRVDEILHHLRNPKRP